MADLVFHLGITKTGTSFLQRRLFNGKINTFDRAIEWSADAKEALQFQRYFLDNSESIWRTPFGRAWFSRMSKGAQDTIVISHESLFEHIPFITKAPELLAEPELLARRLSAIRESCWTEGSVKAVFFFRRQADWLASMYAHIAYALDRPSQRDFEERVQKIISPTSDYGHILKFNLLFEALLDALGRGNVLALPYERFSDRNVWTRIEEFTGIAGLYDRIPFSDKSVNTKRQEGSGDWQLGGRRFHLAGLDVNQRLQVAARHLLGKNITERLKKTVRPKWQLKLPDSLRDEIMSYYESSNRTLSHQCGIDLADEGYYSTKTGRDELKV